MGVSEGRNGELFDLESFTEPAKELKRLDNLAQMELRKLECALRRGKILTAAQRQAYEGITILVGYLIAVIVGTDHKSGFII